METSSAALRQNKNVCYFYKATCVAENLTNSITDLENVDTLKESHIVPLLQFYELVTFHNISRYLSVVSVKRSKCVFLS